MKFVSTIISILVLSFGVFAQQTTVQPAQQQETEIWRAFAPVLEEFTLDVPYIAAPGIINIATAKTINSRSYRVFFNNTYYFMFSDAVKTPLQEKAVLSFVEDSAKGIAPNTVFSFTDKFGFYNKVLIVQSNSRIYTFQTVSPNKDHISANRFFDSLKINGTSIHAKEFDADNLDENTSESSGEQFVVSSAISGNNPVIRTGGQTTPLILQTKPRANYTEYARFYQIEGAVRVKVTFGADGKIGKVWATNKLPFGLTEAVLEAAKKIEFTPAAIDGKTVTLVKTIEYSFSLI
ncbi:MAG: energy transducer TonB [Pyrinomonadaceae bacterium]